MIVAGSQSACATQDSHSRSKGDTFGGHAEHPPVPSPRAPPDPTGKRRTGRAGERNRSHSHRSASRAPSRRTPTVRAGRGGWRQGAGAGARAFSSIAGGTHVQHCRRVESIEREGDTFTVNLEPTSNVDRFPASMAISFTGRRGDRAKMWQSPDRYRGTPPKIYILPQFPNNKAVGNQSLPKSQCMRESLDGLYRGLDISWRVGGASDGSALSWKRPRSWL